MIFTSWTIYFQRLQITYPIVVLINVRQFITINKQISTSRNKTIFRQSFVFNNPYYVGVHIPGDFILNHSILTIELDYFSPQTVLSHTLHSLSICIMHNSRCTVDLTFCKYLDNSDGYQQFTFSFSLCLSPRKIFFLCVTPNILNGFHLNSYLFIAKDPSYHFCMVDELRSSGWTNDQLRNFTQLK